MTRPNAIFVEVYGSAVVERSLQLSTPLWYVACEVPCKNSLEKQQQERQADDYGIFGLIHTTPKADMYT